MNLLASIISDLTPLVFAVAALAPLVKACHRWHVDARKLPKTNRPRTASRMENQETVTKSSDVAPEFGEFNQKRFLQILRKDHWFSIAAFIAACFALGFWVSLETSSALSKSDVFLIVFAVVNLHCNLGIIFLGLYLSWKKGEFHRWDK